MSVVKRLFVIIAMITIMVSISSCAYEEEPAKAIGGADIVQDLGFQIPKNSQGNTTEQQNIIDRLKVTTDVTKVLWIHLITLDGKIVLRMPVSHKVTSSGKRLEPITAGSSNEYGANYPHFTAADGNRYETIEFMQPDGTFGQSDNYIFWFDPQHRYHQWGTAGGLGYLLTDYPIDLRNPQDLITGLYNMDKAAYEWQELQEKQMEE